MKLNFQFGHIHQSATVAIADRVLALKASGKKIIPLQVGDPDFATPQPIKDAAINALKEGFTHYSPSRGFLDLRRAIASKIADYNNMPSNEALPYSPESEILVTHGGVHAYYLAMQSILNPGDEVMIPDPSWATHSNMVKLLRGSVVRVPAPAENGFIPSLDAWKGRLTNKTRAIVINYPANPTGVYPSREYFQQLSDFACENDLWIVSDEVYDNLYYGENPLSASAFPGAKDHTILVNSLSKTYAMTGWRVGYLAAPSRVIDNALKASQNSITCVAPFTQKAAHFALSDESVQITAAEMRTAYGKRRELVMRVAQEYEGSPVGVVPPMGAFYFFLDFRSLKMSSQEICEQILDEKGVGLIPGSAFGEQGEGFVRMSIAASNSDIEAGIRAILDWASSK
jgi:aspartate/methionine/tyrosine aminotransferase